MNAIKHFQFGYLNQIFSIFFLSLNIIILPNVLSIDTYSQLILYLSFIGIVSMTINESASLVVINKYSNNRGNETFQTFFRYNIEHGFLSLLIFFLYIFLLNPESLSLQTLIILFICALAINYYVLVSAYFIGTKKNHIVTILLTSSSAINFVIPILIFFKGLDMIYAVVGQSLSYILLASIFAPINKMQKGVEKDFWREKVILSSDFFNILIANGVKPLIVWVPVILFAQKGFLEESASYRIAIGIIFASISLIPYNKSTLLSLQNDFSKTLSRYVDYALIVGALLTLFFYILSKYISLIYPGYDNVNHFLLMLSPVPFFLLFFDMAIVKLTTNKKFFRLSSIPLVALICVLIISNVNPSMNFITSLLIFFLLVSLQSIYYVWSIDRFKNNKSNDINLCINLIHLLLLSTLFLSSTLNTVTLNLIIISFVFLTFFKRISLH